MFFNLEGTIKLLSVLAKLDCVSVNLHIDRLQRRPILICSFVIVSSTGFRMQAVSLYSHWQFLILFISKNLYLIVETGNSVPSEARIPSSKASILHSSITIEDPKSVILDAYFHELFCHILYTILLTFRLLNTFFNRFNLKRQESRIKST